MVSAASDIVQHSALLSVKFQLFQHLGKAKEHKWDDAKAGGEAANGSLFPCGRLLVAASLSDDHPQKALLLQYKKDYETQYKEEVSTFGGHAYDAVLLLTEAIKAAGEDRAGQDIPAAAAA